MGDRVGRDDIRTRSEILGLHATLASSVTSQIVPSVSRASVCRDLVHAKCECVDDVDKEDEYRRIKHKLGAKMRGKHRGHSSRYKMDLAADENSRAETGEKSDQQKGRGRKPRIRFGGRFVAIEDRIMELVQVVCIALEGFADPADKVDDARDKQGNHDDLTDNG